MKYYLIGVKGSGMSALASLLHDLGHTIIGYDDSTGYKFTMEGLNARHIKIYHKDDNRNIPEDFIVSYTAAIDDNHEEVLRMRKTHHQIIPYRELMGELSEKLKTLCVCGTHGKTTTTLMISEILNKAWGCSYFVGDGTGYGNKNSNLLVMESCEFNKHFLSYHPLNTVITNIELDHTETYPNIQSMIDTFQEFVDKTKDFVVLCGDDENILKLNVKKPYYYGFNENNSLVIKNKKVQDNKTMFDIYYQGKKYDHYEVKMFGNHLILDCAASIMASILYNVPKNIIKNILENFIPPKRRFNETILGNNIIVDDYAHHPTEIRVTYDSAHQKYPNKKIIAIFLPNTYSRTEALFNDFVKALSYYDKAYLMDILSDRESKRDYPNISSEMLKEKIPNSEMIDINTVDKLKEYDNTVFCFMSCAYISPMIEKAKQVLLKK